MLDFRPMFPNLICDLNFQFKTGFFLFFSSKPDFRPMFPNLMRMRTMKMTLMLLSLTFKLLWKAVVPMVLMGPMGPMGTMIY